MKPYASKLNLVEACNTLSSQRGFSNASLCIGDRGQWPGNDFELLSTPFSLSVDEISNDPDILEFSFFRCKERTGLFRIFKNYSDMRKKNFGDEL